MVGTGRKRGKGILIRAAGAGDRPKLTAIVLDKTGPSRTANPP